MASSFAQMVCDNEIAATVGRLRRGFIVDEDSLAAEVIGAAMAGSRGFLGQKHTLRYLRPGEVLYTHLAERRTWEVWDWEGREGMVERAQAEAERLLAEHELPPLTEDQERALEEIFREAETELAHS